MYRRYPPGMPPRPRPRLPGFGERLRAFRTGKDLTLDAVATAVGVKRSAVGHWEAGIREPTLSELVALARLLGTTTDRLLGAKR